ncbi:hypothetical protein [Nocardioides alcanivorans]|nr:hypothetical protein [Nocardioides alcanivorans]
MVGIVASIDVADALLADWRSSSARAGLLITKIAAFLLSAIAADG